MFEFSASAKASGHIYEITAAAKGWWRPLSLETDPPIEISLFLVAPTGELPWIDPGRCSSLPKGDPVMVRNSQYSCGWLRDGGGPAVTWGRVLSRGTKSRERCPTALLWQGAGVLPPLCSQVNNRARNVSPSHHLGNPDVTEFRTRARGGGPPVSLCTLSNNSQCSNWGILFYVDDTTLKGVRFVIIYWGTRLVNTHRPNIAQVRIILSARNLFILSI